MSLLPLLVVLTIDRSATITSERAFSWVEDGKSKLVKQVSLKAMEFEWPRQVNGVYVARAKFSFDQRENFIALKSHPVDVVVVLTEGKKKSTLTGARIKQVLGIMPSHRIDAKQHGPTLDVTIEAKRLNGS
ncbi:MAG: hypothetical protein HONBIEJF_01477 [Fimbriimonadaceae bacterium]|nr:hypothetical protein [Fimbriimonadaceae bacterium]